MLLSVSLSSCLKADLDAQREEAVMAKNEADYWKAQADDSAYYVDVIIMNLQYDIALIDEELHPGLEEIFYYQLDELNAMRPYIRDNYYDPGLCELDEGWSYLCYGDNVRYIDATWAGINYVSSKEHYNEAAGYLRSADTGYDGLFDQLLLLQGNIANYL